jgi:2-polyprenyl-6-methoxyphenol hydroxylase-like FAD-dependent oxidoreductase
MRGDLERLLFAYVPPSRLRFNTTIRSFEERHRGVRVTFSDGTETDCDALVGADGMHSRVRELLFGQESLFVRRLGYRAVSFTSAESWPRLLGDDLITLTIPSRQVAVYAGRRGLATFFVYRAAAGDPASPCEQLRRHFGDLPWIVPALLHSCESATAMYTDDIGQVVVPQWYRGRSGLVGDACQCVSPLAGQGASLAVFGATVLADELEHAPDVPSALARYQARVQPLVIQRQAAGRRLAAWRLPDSSWRRAARDVALRTSLTPLIARLFKRHLVS